jgi:peptide/nickel transport system substrate-binding protein
MNKKYVALAIVVLVIGASVAGYQFYTQSEKARLEQEKWKQWQDTLIVGTTLFFENPDPNIGHTGFDEVASAVTCDYLWTIDRDKAGVNPPRIAQSWEMKQTSDGRYYLEVKIRQGLKFQDGTPVNAQAVKFSWDRAPKVEPRKMTYHASHQELVVTDDYTLRIYMKTSFTPELFAWMDQGEDYGVIYSPTSVDKAGNDGMKIVGNGRYQWKEWVTGERCVFTAWPDYPWGVPKAKTLIVRFFADPASMRMALEKGEIDIALKDFTKEDILALQKNPNVVVELRPSGFTRNLMINQKSKPFDNILVRQALAYAIDPSECLNKTQRGLSSPAYSMVQDWMKYYNPIFHQMYPYDPVKAKQLLANAGYPNGFDTTLWYSTRYDVAEDEKSSATVFQSQLAKIGIRAELKFAEWGAFSTYRNTGDVMPLALIGWKFDYPDPDTQLYALMQATGGRSYDWYGYKNDTVENLLLRERSLWSATGQDPPERKRIFDELQTEMARNVVTIPLWHATEYEIYRNYVKNYHAYWTTYYHDFNLAEKEIPKTSGASSALADLRLALVTGIAELIPRPDMM